MKITLPRPLPHQIPILASGARHKLCCMGRKWGKTTGCLIAVVDGHGPAGKFRGAARGAQGLWAAPTAGIAADVWRDLKWATRFATIDKSEVERRIALPGGGSVTVRSADNPDSLRGPNYDFVVLDEAAFCHEDAWGLVLRPTLAATGGWSMFISTPKGQNWFWEQFNKCENDPSWERWQCPTSDNPRIPAKELEDTLRDQGSYRFAQEHLAQFVTPGGNLFDRSHAQFYTRADLEGANIPDKFITVDTACTEKSTTADFTCIAVWGVTRGGKLTLLDLDMRRLGAPAICEAIKAKSRLHDCIAWIEATTQSRHLLSFLSAEGVVFRELDPGARDKVTRASWAQGLWEQNKIVFPKDAPWLNAIESQLYAFPDPNTHDDFVDCLAWAAYVMRFGSVELPQFGGVVKPREYLPMGLGALPRPSWLGN